MSNAIAGVETVTRISPAGFARLKQALLEAELEGYGPEACAMLALAKVGLPLRPTTLIVDYSLEGPIYPFVDRPEELKQ